MIKRMRSVIRLEGLGRTDVEHLFFTSVQRLSRPLLGVFVTFSHESKVMCWMWTKVELALKCYKRNINVAIT